LGSHVFDLLWPDGVLAVAGVTALHFSGVYDTKLNFMPATESMQKYIYTPAYISIPWLGVFCVSSETEPRN